MTFNEGRRGQCANMAEEAYVKGREKTLKIIINI
jgi:hypothetical protein